MNISKEEIHKCIKKTIKKKYIGENLVIYDFVKSATNTFVEIYKQLFNVMFETNVIVPLNWLYVGNIKQIDESKIINLILNPVKQ